MEVEFLGALCNTVKLAWLGMDFVVDLHNAYYAFTIYLAPIKQLIISQTGSPLT